MDDLIALAERCEAATGADREIDADIALTRGWSVCADDNWIGPRGEICVPNYTASLYSRFATAASLRARAAALKLEG